MKEVQAVGTFRDGRDRRAFRAQAGVWKTQTEATSGGAFVLGAVLDRMLRAPRVASVRVRYKPLGREPKQSLDCLSGNLLRWTHSGPSFQRHLF